MARAQHLWAKGLRLDASYHASKGTQALRFIERWRKQARPTPRPTSKVKELGARYTSRDVDRLDSLCPPDGIFIPSRFKRVFVEDPAHGMPYLTGGAIVQADPLAGAKYLARRFTTNAEELALREGMILVTCSGTIGNSIYVNRTLEGSVGSPDLLRIVADPNRIPPGYLFAFLASALGRALIEQKTYGAVVPHIEAHHVVDLPVLRLGSAIERRAHKMIERAAALRAEASALLTTAQSRLFEIAGLPRMTHRETLTKGCWSFVVQRGRYGRHALTAWTHNPVTRSVRKQVESYHHALLAELVQPDGVFYGNHFRRIDADPSAGIMLLSQGDVFKQRPEGRWISKRSVKDYRDYMVPGSATLVAAQGTMGDNELFGHCQYSHRNYETCMITQHILRVLPDSAQVDPGYLFAYLSSEYGFHLLRSTACGTKLLGFILDLVREVPVPMAAPELQRQIGAMVCRAYDNRAEALALEDEVQSLLAEALSLEMSY